MALSFSCCGIHATPQTAARIFVRSTTDGVLTAVVDGTTYTGDTLDTGTSDGCGIVDITGLSAGSTYTATLSVGGSEVGTQTIKTLPSGAFRLAWGSCAVGATNGLYALKMKALAPDVFISQGDDPYTSVNSNPFWKIGTASNSGTAALSADTYYPHHRRQRNNPARKALMATGVLFGYAADDHEYAGDNWDHTPTQAQGSSADIRNTAGVSDPPTQAQVDDAWLAGNTAVLAYSLGNPDNDDSGVAAQKPSNADAGTAASQYPAQYFRFGNSLCEVFVIDCHSHRSPQADTDDASKTMLGSTQKSWLKARLLASTATFKIIMTGKYLFPIGDETGSADDKWGAYTTERDELLAYIHSNVTGCVWLAGDKHISNVAAAYTADGASWDAACITACPLDNTQSYHTGALGTYTRGLFGRSQSVVDDAFGLVDMDDDALTISIIRALDGSTMWSGQIAAGSNALIYPARTLALA